MEIKDLDPALAAAMQQQRGTLTDLAALAGAKGAFGRLCLRYGEQFQNALTCETLRRTSPEDIMEAVGRMAGYQMTCTALQFLHLVPPEEKQRALFIMLQAMMTSAADYSNGMIASYLADEAPVVHFTMHESGPVEVRHSGGVEPQ
ncbi:hypothetical protein [Ancylobacter sp. IITR112]|uniref:hypothetical protein n=1 Tax=Ancylobacter sp. IITR112 TaxID=3138073 RepID=UPI00352BB7E3